MTVISPHTEVNYHSSLSHWSCCLVTLSSFKTTHDIFPRCIFPVMRWKDSDLGVVCVNKLCMGVACLPTSLPSAADVSRAIFPDFAGSLLASVQPSTRPHDRESILFNMRYNDCNFSVMQMCSLQEPWLFLGICPCPWSFKLCGTGTFSHHIHMMYNNMICSAAVLSP